MYRWVDIKELDMKTGKQVPTIRCYLRPSSEEVEFKVLEPEKANEQFIGELRKGIQSSRGAAQPSDGLVYLLRLRHTFKSSCGRRATSLKRGTEDEFASPSHK